MTSTTAGTDQVPGRVVAGYGRRVLVEDSDGQRHRCVFRGRKLRAVCGDYVTWHKAGREGVVTGIEPRQTELCRPDKRGRKEVLAANVSRVMVVAAPKPAPDAFIVDRYLAAAQFMGIDAAVVFNKTDLLDGQPAPEWLDDFRAAGYEVALVSAKTDDGMHELSTLMKGNTNILVGQSGVGKSSLLNNLVPGLDLATQTLSRATDEGRHTTTASVLHHTPANGDIIDSPGVRDFAPAPVPVAEVDHAYREFAPWLDQCRFANCRHLAEPDCAVKAALEKGEIPARRYESYRRLFRLMEKLKPSW